MSSAMASPAHAARRPARNSHGPAAAPAPQRLRREWTVPAPPAGRATPGRPCSCGGTCPRCAGRGPALRLSQPADASERQADALAARVAAGESVSLPPAFAASSGLRRAAAASASAVATAPQPLASGLRSPSSALDGATRHTMESRLGHDLSAVRIHSGGAAAASAAAVQARAYTVGHDIVFGAGQYAPATHGGRQLLAHELVHVLQQRAGHHSSPLADGVQRAPTIGVLPADFVGPPSAAQRRAAASCPISCCNWNLGTLHTMPLFFHESRGAIVAEGSPRATGIGAELHFIATPEQPPAHDLCHCDAYQMIQVVTTTHVTDGRGNHSFVDNGNQGTQPFYGAPAGIGRAGHGEHAIPAGYADGGERVSTTESIYDRPFRTHGDLGTTSLRWQAETCVACVKNAAPDRVLGCTTYGFTQHYDTTRAAFDPVQQIAPGCRGGPSANFIGTLGTDPTTTAYDFQVAPSASDCAPKGDFPLPRGDTRMA